MLTARDERESSDATDMDGDELAPHVKRVVESLVKGRRVFLTSAFVKFGAAAELWVCGADAWYRSAGAGEVVDALLKSDMGADTASNVSAKVVNNVLKQLRNLATPNKSAPNPAVRTLSACDLTTMRNTARRHVIFPEFAAMDLKQGHTATVRLQPADALVLPGEVVPVPAPSSTGEEEVKAYLKTTFKRWRLLLHLVVRTLRGDAHKFTVVLYSALRDTSKGFLVYLLNLLLGKALCPVRVNPYMCSKAFAGASDISGPKRPALVSEGSCIICHYDDRDAGDATVAYAALKQQQSAGGKLWISGTTESIGAVVAPLVMVTTNYDPTTIFTGMDETASDKILVFEACSTPASQAAFESVRAMTDTADGKERVRHQLLELLVDAANGEAPDCAAASLRSWTAKKGAQAHKKSRAPAVRAPEAKGDKQGRVKYFLTSDKADGIYLAGKGAFLDRSAIFQAAGVDFTAGGKGAATAVKKVDAEMLKRHNVCPVKSRGAWGYPGLAFTR